PRFESLDTVGEIAVAPTADGYLRTTEAAAYLRFRSPSGTAVMRRELQPAGVGPRGRCFFDENTLTSSSVHATLLDRHGLRARRGVSMCPTRYPGIMKIAENTYQIRVRVKDPRTGKLKGVRRTRECTLKEAVALQAQWRDEARRTFADAKRERIKLAP